MRTPKANVQKRYPKAYSHSPNFGRTWRIWSGNPDIGNIGQGKSPAAAWKAADRALRDAIPIQP